MELLGFLMAVLAIAFVVAKVVFNREVQKAKITRRIEHLSSVSLVPQSSQQGVWRRRNLRRPSLQQNHRKPLNLP